jgi:hypothetical protein
LCDLVGMGLYEERGVEVGVFGQAGISVPQVGLTNPAAHAVACQQGVERLALGVIREFIENIEKTLDT